MRPGAAPSCPCRKPAGVAVGDEADVVAVRLVGDGQAALGRLLAHLLLGDVAEREHGPRQLVAGQHGEHVRLILGRVHAAGQPDQPSPRPAPGRAWWPVQTASKPSATARSRTAANLIFSLQRRHGFGRVAARVLGDEVLDDVGVEPLGHVPDIERDADHVGGPPGVAGVLQRAAAARAGPVRARVPRQRQVHAGDVVAGLGGPAPPPRRSPRRRTWQPARAAESSHRGYAAAVSARRRGGPARRPRR